MVVTIDRVEMIPISYPEPNDGGQPGHTVLVRVETDDGHVGWGEGWTRAEEATIATCRLIEALSPFVLAREPKDVQAIWHDLRRHTYWYGWGGLASIAISAIDIAVWDLLGKVHDRSLLSLLGGPAVAHLPAIASGHLKKARLEDLVEDAQSYIAAGFRGYKFGMGTYGEAKIGISEERDADFVTRLRDALGPPERATLIVDARAAVDWDLDEAIRRAKVLEDQQVKWLEEPFGRRERHLYVELARATSIPLGAGEKEWTVEGYRDYMQQYPIDIIAADPGRVEGITGTLRICAGIEHMGRYFNAHSWSTGIVAAASLAVALNSAASLLFEQKPLTNPGDHELIAQPLAPSADGYIGPLEGPGLGITVDEDAVNFYRTK